MTQSDQFERDFSRDFPKVELHRHLDGAVRLRTVWEEAKRHGVKLPVDRFEDLQPHVQVLKPMKNLAEVLNTFWLTQSVFRDEETLERIAYENVEDAWNDGTRLVELRYSPEFCATNHGHTYNQILNAFKRGIERAKEKYPMGVGLIPIISRTLSKESAWKTVEHVLDNRDDFVGFDLADDESGFDPRTFSEMFQELIRNKIRITIHSGEEGPPENVLKSIEYLGAERIGHGIQIHRSHEAIEAVKKAGVLLEVCPSSNYLTRAVPSLSEHPLKRLYEAGVRVSINTDDPGIMNLTLPGEYAICEREFHFSESDFRTMNRDAFEASFLSDREKEKLKTLYFSDLF